VLVVNVEGLLYERTVLESAQNVPELISFCCGRSVPVQALGFGARAHHVEVNVSAVPEGITSADVIVWGEGGTFAQQISAGRHRLTGDEPESVGGTDARPSPYDSCSPLSVPAPR
jgi:hypothetical protein